MGRPKALLDFDGKAALQLVLDACERAELAAAIVVTRAELAPLVTPLVSGRARVVVNETPERGQTSSLSTGLAHVAASARAFLIYPVDYPLVRAEQVVRLCRAFTSSARVVAPSHGGRRGHPVVVDVSLIPALLALPPEGSAREVLARHADATVYVTSPDDDPLMDMDTPEAYQSCLTRYRARAA